MNKSSNLDKPILFIHTPKTAGVSVVHTLGKSITKRIHSMKTTAEEYIIDHKLDGYFKFGFKRNPYNRYLSLYSYFKQMTPEHPYFKYNGPIVNVVSRYKCIDDFAEDFYDLRLRNNFHFKPQYNYLMKKSGDPLVDYMGSVENFENDLRELARIIGIQNSANLSIKSRNITNKTEPVGLTTKVIKLVNDFYAKDFQLLNYKLLEK